MGSCLVRSCNHPFFHKAILSENVAYLDDNNNIQTGHYMYVYNMYNEKCYYDTLSGSPFFKIKNDKRINLTLVENVWDNNCEFKKISIDGSINIFHNQSNNQNK